MVLVAGIANAQTNEIDSLKKYLKFEKDAFSNKIELVPNDTITGVTKDGYAYVIRAQSHVRPGKFRNLTLKIGCEKLACVDNSSSIDYLLSNDDKFRMQNGSQYNCLGVFFGVWQELSGYYKNLEKISSTNVKAIRLNSRLDSSEIYLTPQQSELLKNQMKWLKYFYDNRFKIEKMKIY